MCLAALQRLVQPPADGDGSNELMAGTGTAAVRRVSGVTGLDAGAVVSAARVAPDGATRNQALALLAVLARSHPQTTLQHVVDVSCSP
jgi:hypothetical protein